MAKKSKSSDAKTKRPATQSGLIDIARVAPDFSLPDQDGKTHRLKDYRGRWIVLYFYPKDNTSGCTAQACDFRDQWSRLQRRKAVVFGVSPDSIGSHRKFVSKFDLPFVLLADEDRTICSRYGVWQEKSMYGRKYMGVVRTTYLIDPKGKVSHRWDKVKVRGHVEQLLTTLKNT